MLWKKSERKVDIWSRNRIRIEIKRIRNTASVHVLPDAGEEGELQEAQEDQAATQQVPRPSPATFTAIQRFIPLISGLAWGRIREK